MLKLLPRKPSQAGAVRHFKPVYDAGKWMIAAGLVPGRKVNRRTWILGSLEVIPFDERDRYISVGERRDKFLCDRQAGILFSPFS